MLTKCFAACTHLSSTVSQLFALQVQKIAVFTYRSPHFCFPWRRPIELNCLFIHVAWMKRQHAQTNTKIDNVKDLARIFVARLQLAYAVVRCLSVLLAVCHVRLYSIKMSKHILILFYLPVATPFYFFHTNPYDNNSVETA